MKILDPGHRYQLDLIDETGSQELVFVKREGKRYPGNIGAYSGVLTQEVLRACIDRAIYLNNQIPCAETEIIIASLRTALFAFEARAARCRGSSFSLVSLTEIDNAQTCEICGHNQCDFQRHRSLPNASK
jgi:hypothetical protein